MVDNNESQKEGKVKWEIDFPTCPHCGCKDTVMRQSWKAVKGELAPGLHLALRGTMVALVENAGMALALPFVPALIASYDICANPECGMERCVRVEVKTIDSRVIAAAMGVNIQSQQQRGPVGFRPR